MANFRDVNQMGAFFNVKVGSIDVTPAVSLSGVTILDQEDKVRVCTFTLKDAYFWMDKISRGVSVTVIAGSMDVKNRKEGFKGSVKKVDVSFPQAGAPELTVVAWGGTYRGTRRSSTVVYPSPNCQRLWAREEEISLREIVEGIIHESFYTLGSPTIDIPEAYNHVFTYKKPFTQNSTDWMALRTLASLCNCVLAEVDDGSEVGQHKIIFAEITKYKDEIANSEKASDKKISFRYINRDTTTSIIDNTAYVYANREFTSPNIEEHEIVVEHLTLSQNIEANSGSLRMVTDFSEVDGSSKIYVQQLKESGDDEELITYELKPTNDPIWNDERANSMWNKLTFSWDSVTLEDILPFFVPVPSTVAQGYEKTDVGMRGAGPLAMKGFEISATIIGYTNLSPYRNYTINGLGKFSKYRWYLKSIEHVFSESGFLQNLHFYC